MSAESILNQKYFEETHQHVTDGVEDVGDLVLDGLYTKLGVSVSPLDAGGGYGVSNFIVQAKMHPSDAGFTTIAQSNAWPTANVSRSLYSGTDGSGNVVACMVLDFGCSPYALKFRTDVSPLGDLITDGDMSNAASWTEGASGSVTIAAGVGAAVCTQNGGCSIYQPVTFPAAGVYTLSLDITNLSGPIGIADNPNAPAIGVIIFPDGIPTLVTAYVGGTYSVGDGTISANGTYQIDVTVLAAGTVDFVIYFSGSASATETFDLDSVSIIGDSSTLPNVTVRGNLTR